MRFTEEQERAVAARGTNLLLGAAAGSGKTTVLVGRALALMDEGVSVDRMLIVTFTRAAAGDMRAKLTEKLAERAGDPRCARQLLRLERASITTLHAFCADFLRENFELAGTDPNFRVLDDPEANRLEERALDDAMEEAYAAFDEELSALDYGRGPAGVRQLAAALMAWLNERADPEAWLDGACRWDGEAVGRWTGALIASARRALRLAETRFLTARDNPECPAHYAASLDTDLEALRAILREREYEPLRAAMRDFRATTPRGRNTGVDENALQEIKKMRDDGKAAISSAAILDYPLAQALSDAEKMCAQLRTLGRIALSAREKFTLLKQERGGLTYSDLEQMTLSALSRPEAQAVVREKYDCVFVDEYQDTSELQEALIQRIARNDNLFMVGDVKQSIYRFRLAEPELFTEKYAAYRAGQGGVFLPLTRNFRSGKSIIDFVNAVFSRVMTGGDAEVEYDDAARLRAGLEEDSPPVEIHFFEKGENARQESEADGIARLILQRKREDPTLRWSDIAVITRTGSGSFAKLMPALLAHGIPAYAGGGGGYFESAEMLLALSLLKLVGNARSDVELIGVLRSPCVGLAAEDLARIRIACPAGTFSDAARAYCGAPDPLGEKLREIFAKLDAWRLYSAAAGPGDLARRVFSESGLMLLASALPGGVQRRGNLDRLCDLGDAFERNNSGSLPRFLSHIESQAEKGEGESASILSEADDVVRLMTVHHSKGLEFRVVIGAFLDRRYSGREKASNLAVHRALGAGFRYCDPVLESRRSTLPMAAINEKKQIEDAAEEMRVLYVLLTRAKERLILTATPASRQSAELRWRAMSHTPSAASSHLDLMMSALSGQEEPFYRVVWHDPEEPDEAAFSAPAGEELPPPDPAALSWVYPAPLDAARPLKLTASGLSREIEGPDEMEAMHERPAFLSGESGELSSTERGTAYHAVLCRADLARLRGASQPKMAEELRREIDEFVKRGILRDVERDAVSTEKLARFYGSPIGRELLSAKTVRREWPFNVMMSVREALGTDDDGEILVQGMVDCCFIQDGKWILLDYKTDRARDLDAIKSHYSRQLDTYALALERITGIPVAKKILCLVGMELAIEV